MNEEHTLSTLEELLASEDEIRKMLNSEDPLEGIYGIYADLGVFYP